MTGRRSGSAAVLARQTRLWLIGVAVLGGLGADPLRAQERSVTVVAILATDKNATIEAKVKPIAEEVKKLEPALTGFRLVRTTSKTLTLGKKDQFPLVDDEMASVLLQDAMANNRIRVTVKAPKQGEITYDCCCSKFFPIMTRYQTKDGERLILAIMVKPAKP